MLDYVFDLSVHQDLSLDGRLPWKSGTDPSLQFLYGMAYIVASRDIATSSKLWLESYVASLACSYAFINGILLARPTAIKNGSDGFRLF